MRNHDDCCALGQVEVCKKFDDFLFVLAVQISGGFIGKDERGAVC